MKIIATVSSDLHKLQIYSLHSLHGLVMVVLDSVNSGIIMVKGTSGCGLWMMIDAFDIFFDVLYTKPQLLLVVQSTIPLF